MNNLLLKPSKPLSQAVFFDANLCPVSQINHLSTANLQRAAPSNFQVRKRTRLLVRLCSSLSAEWRSECKLYQSLRSVREISCTVRRTVDWHAELGADYRQALMKSYVERSSLNSLLNLRIWVHFSRSSPLDTGKGRGWSRI